VSGAGLSIPPVSGLVIASLRRRLARTILTATGIAVGVAAVVALISLGDGLKQTAAGFIHLGKADLGLFQKGVSDPTASVLPTSMVPRLERQPGVARATPIQLLVEAIPHQPAAIAFGLDPKGFDFERLVVVDGRRSAAPGETMVGDQLAKQARIAPGDTLTIKKRPFKVAGVFHSGNTFEDDGAMISLKTAQQMAGHPDSATTIAVALDRGARAGPTTKALERAFPGTVAINDPGEAARADANSLLVGKAVLVIVVLALAIGGIAVTNTMVMAVLERERELSLLSAVGWSRMRVARLILAEGVGVSLLGAAIGLALGLAVSSIVVHALSAQAFVSPNITAWGLGRGCLLGVAIGVLGGLYPAWRVTRLMPAESLARA
jgi:putative ABC transport system permease protein